MTGTIILIVVLILAALLLFAVEICTPTFGVLGLAGVGALAWAVYLAFELNPIFGIATLVALLIGVPVYLWATVKWLPKTAVGRILQLRIRKAAPGEGTPDAAAQKSLVGRTAMTETPLRPSGAIRVDGKRVIASAEAGFIESGCKVRIVKATGMNVVVREVDSDS